MSKIVPGTILSYGRKFNDFSYIKFVLYCNDNGYDYTITHNEQNMIYLMQSFINAGDWVIYQ